jgi:hypothetical protein
MSRPTVAAIPLCTIRRHPSGGFTPVLHLSEMPAPDPATSEISLPDVGHAVQYARDHYGTLPVLVSRECMHVSPRPEWSFSDAQQDGAGA